MSSESITVCLEPQSLGELAAGGKIEECKKVSAETGFRGQIG